MQKAVTREETASIAAAVLLTPKELQAIELYW